MRRDLVVSSLISSFGSKSSHSSPVFQSFSLSHLSAILTTHHSDSLLLSSFTMFSLSLLFVRVHLRSCFIFWPFLSSLFFLLFPYLTYGSCLFALRFFLFSILLFSFSPPLDLCQPFLLPVFSLCFRSCCFSLSFPPFDLALSLGVFLASFAHSFLFIFLSLFLISLILFLSFSLSDFLVRLLFLFLILAFSSLALVRFLSSSSPVLLSLISPPPLVRHALAVFVLSPHFPLPSPSFPAPPRPSLLPLRSLAALSLSLAFCFLLKLCPLLSPSRRFFLLVSLLVFSFSCPFPRFLFPPFKLLSRLPFRLSALAVAFGFSLSPSLLFLARLSPLFSPLSDGALLLPLSVCARAVSRSCLPPSLRSSSASLSSLLSLCSLPLFLPLYLFISLFLSIYLSISSLSHLPANPDAPEP
ncbi:hypothetical protein C7M84_010193 [Penaeus vannamei]|uniref:Uncharacterized protein n=1 Tax=Penaeus vannamei TaxID=6689 RepID=A0A3R7PMN6_PENVA|nr:hypothetical protein C7M84_010193 [Penaeus vannamei]